jgi:hypothetical protein
VRIDPPERHTKVLFWSPGYRHLPILTGLARQPYLRDDGSLMTTAGYDGSTKMFGVFDPKEFSVPERPTRTDAEAAFALLGNLLGEFRLGRSSDFAAAMSALLTAAIRPSLDHAPMFHARAHMVGSGKSCLCELFSAFSTPQRPVATAFPADEEECTKLLLATLLPGPAVIQFDNLTRDLVPHKSLCMALTSEYMSGRILGISKTATVNTRALFLSSGNNVGPVQDMTRRCITINLDPGVEMPAARTFERPNLIQDVLDDRSAYVSAALTIVRAFVVAGMPHTACRSMAGYDDWSSLCRQPLLWLGMADPTESVFDAMLEDPDRETLDRLLRAWEATFGNRAAMVRDALGTNSTFVENIAELREVILDIAGERGEVNRRKFGWWMKRHAGQIVDGRRFVRARVVRR